MKALARRLAAVEYRRAQHQHRRIVWPSVADALRAGVTWPILVIGDVLPADEWAVLAKKQQAELRKEIDHA
jgi:hypothetical protein